MNEFSSIKNFRQPLPDLYTCGQPTEEDLEEFANTGVQVVINLALHDDPNYSLADEAAVVAHLGMDYIHIPVQFDHPTRQDLLDFFKAMQENKNRKLLIHCAANMRVTAFLGLFWLLQEGWEREEAFQLMDSIWQPNPTWTAFIGKMIADF